MKTIELSGVNVEDVGALFYDLLQKGFDVESVGRNADATFIYMADEEDKNPQPVVQRWVGKAPQHLSRETVERRRKDIMQLLENARKTRVERAAQRAQDEVERRALGLPELQLTVTGNHGALGIAEALSNGIDSHTVLIQKVDPDNKLVDGSEELLVKASHKVAISDIHPKLDGGMAMIQIGPSSAVGDFTIEVKDRSGRMKTVKLPLCFVVQRSEQSSPPPPPLEKHGGIMSVVKKILGI